LLVEDAPGGGALVRGIDPRSVFADRLLPGDVILEVNRRQVPSANALRGELAKVKRGETVLLKVQREGRTRFVAIEAP
jgi:serine protease Do